MNTNFQNRSLSKEYCNLTDKEIYLNGDYESYMGDYCIIKEREKYLNGEREFYAGEYCKLAKTSLPKP